MTDITVHLASNDWCVHFVVTATQIPVGPWLLFDSNDEIKAKLFTWGHVAEEDLTQNLELQTEALTKVGCKKIFSDKRGPLHQTSKIVR
jgi:hypothetical protein